MLKVILRRILVSIPILLSTTAITFLLVSFIPGDPAVWILGPDASPEQYDKVREALGFDLPVWQQYLNWLGGAVQGDLGTSLMTYQEVNKLLLQRVPVTLTLAVLGLALCTFLGASVGLYGALKGGRIGRLIDGFSIVGLALPNFSLALLIVVVFAIYIPLFPAVGYQNFTDGPFRWAYFLVLPVFAISLHGFAVISKQTRDSVVTVMGMDFIRMMQANGFSKKSIIFRHILRNAAIPVVTVIGLVFVNLLSGSVAIEMVFALPGLGSALVASVHQHDLPVLVGIVFYISILVVVVNFVVDITYAWLDPRVVAL